MREIKVDSTYKGTRILIGNTKRDKVNSLLKKVFSKYPNAEEIQIPIIHNQKVFENKVGEENNNLMYTFSDLKGRNLCLAPEYTSVIQELQKGIYKQEKDVVLFYVSECFRGEKPQRGRYRQFTQFGLEILNPSLSKEDLLKEVSELALELCKDVRPDLEFTLDLSATRGLNFYEEGKGFEIIAESLGSSKQVCGGGFYEGGFGFAIGLDRLIFS